MGYSCVGIGKGNKNVSCVVMSVRVSSCFVWEYSA